MKNIESQWIDLMKEIIGETEDMCKFIRHKDSEGVDSFSKTMCEELLPRLQLQVSRKKTELNEKHREWEKEYFLQYGTEPGETDMPKDVKDKYLLFLKSKELLDYWKIRF